MTTRLLPCAEWAKLAGTEAAVAQGLDPRETHIIVVEDAGQIVGTWVLTRIVHAECLWIHERYRHRPSVGRRLLRYMRSAARAMGVSVVWTGAMTDDVRALIDNIGGMPVPGDSYLLPIVEGPCRPS